MVIHKNRPSKIDYCRLKCIDLSSIVTRNYFNSIYCKCCFVGKVKTKLSLVSGQKKKLCTDNSKRFSRVRQRNSLRQDTTISRFERKKGRTIGRTPIHWLPITLRPFGQGAHSAVGNSNYLIETNCSLSPRSSLHRLRFSR